MGEKIPVREGTFVESAEGGALVAGKCQSCGQVFFPKTAFCFDCFDDNMIELILSRRGQLYSYTIGYMPSTHFEPPYAVGYIDMPEGVRVFAPLKILDDKPFYIGMDMEVVIETLWQENDKDVIGYIFKPV